MYFGGLMKIAAAEFKAICLELMDRVARTRESVVITKRGTAVAQLVPVESEPKSLFGYMKGSVTFDGDILAPIEEPWSALTGDEDQIYDSKRAPRLRTKRLAKRKTTKA
jgi:prevent-host-death family protein